MIKVGSTVEMRYSGFNMAFPSKYLNGMCLDHLSPSIECLYKEQICTVVGRSEYYEHPMIALKRLSDGAIFVAQEDYLKIVKIEVKTSNSAALEALQASIKNEIELLFRIEFHRKAYMPEDFKYDEWYEEAREKVYNMPHILVLRNFIEGE